jgi:hypothetical protein
MDQLRLVDKFFHLMAVFQVFVGIVGESVSLFRGMFN